MIFCGIRTPMAASAVFDTVESLRDFLQGLTLCSGARARIGLRSMPAQRRLTLRQLWIKGEELRHRLASAPHLSDLYTGSCEGIANPVEVLAPFAKQLRQLLYYQTPTGVDPSPLHLDNLLPSPDHVESLSLGYNNFTFAALPQLPRHLKSLRFQATFSFPFPSLISEIRDRLRELEWIEIHDVSFDHEDHPAFDADEDEAAIEEESAELNGRMQAALEPLKVHSFI